MKTIRLISIIVVITAAIAISQANAAYRYYGHNAESKFSLFALTDVKNDESGFGASMTLKSDPTAAITYTHMDSFDVYQISKSQETKAGGYPVNLGMAVGFANNRDNTKDNPDGLVSGLEASINLGKPNSSYSIDVKACSLSENVNPFKWLTDSDVLWIGAGISFKF